MDNGKNLLYVSSAVVLMGGGWAAEKKTASNFCASDQMKLIGDRGKLSLNWEQPNMLSMENFLGSGVGWAEQRTKPGACFMAVKGQTVYSSSGRWCVTLAGASEEVSVTVSLCGCSELVIMSRWRSTCARVTLWFCSGHHFMAGNCYFVKCF